MTLPDAITDALPPDDRMRIGTVLSAFPTTVDIQGTAVPASPLSSYFPLVGDVVALIRQDATWLILGRTTDPATGAYPSFQAGQVTVSPAAATLVTVPVTFLAPFRSPPSVVTNLNSAAGPTSGWSTRAFGVTETGFTALATGPAATFTAGVHWQAQEMTQ